MFTGPTLSANGFNFFPGSVTFWNLIGGPVFATDELSVSNFANATTWQMQFLSIAFNHVPNSNGAEHELIAGGHVVSVSVPEPSSFAALAIGIVAVCVRRLLKEASPLQ